MPKWIDDNTIEGEMPDEEFLRKVNEQMTARVEKEEKEGIPCNYGNDGFITVYEEDRSAYKLMVLRYFAVSRLAGGLFEFRPPLRFDFLGINKVGKHVVVEGKRPSAELREFLGLSEFLWHDSLHSGMEDWSLKQQWEWTEAQAVSDCDMLQGLERGFQTKVDELRTELVDFIAQSGRA